MAQTRNARRPQMSTIEKSVIADCMLLGAVDSEAAIPVSPRPPQPHAAATNSARSFQVRLGAANIGAAPMLMTILCADRQDAAFQAGVVLPLKARRDLSDSLSAL